MRTLKITVVLTVLAGAAYAHVGSPDIYLDGKAGPYQLFVTIRPPVVIPGVATLEIRSESPGVREIRAVPLPISGPGAQFTPIPDKLKASPQDAEFFTGALWMMTTGSWQVRLTVDGPQGTGVLSVPVPSVARSTQRMQAGLGALLGLVGIFLIGGVVAIAGAAVREAKLEPGIVPTSETKRRGRIAMSIALAIVIAAVWGGNAWWTSEANSYGQRVYKPLQMKARLDNNGILTLNLVDPGWMKPLPGRVPLFTRKIDDLIADHDHLMHLYAFRQPGLDAVYHLHPDLVDIGAFRLRLPEMRSGNYKLYADIVHSTGFPETLVATVNVPAFQGPALAGDDAAGFAKAWDQAQVTSSPFILPDGYRMEWIRPAVLDSKQPIVFQFRLTDAVGRAPSDMALYMGMLGHAAFVKTDGTVFAHVHPAGSVSMAALLLAQQHSTGNSGMPGMEMTGMDHSGSKSAMLPNQVSFPYGFPAPGRYRLFIQMKHGATIETGIFDANVN
jgi:hypothetical protein